MKPVKPWLVCVVILMGQALLGACQLNEPECDAVCESDWLDGHRYDDSSFDAWIGTAAFDSSIRLSTRFPRPDSAQLRLPVVICAHGFTASTFEWHEFKDTVALRNRLTPGSNQADSILVSRVLLGGHGGDLAHFQASHWRDWLAPIVKEYDTLVARGYTDISIAAASTACPLLLEAIFAGSFQRQPPREVFFIDPIIVPTNKFLTLAALIGPVVGNIEDVGDSLEQKHWYGNRPAEQLEDLYALINRAKNRLENGLALPKGTRLKAYKSRHDNSADPVSALYLKKGLIPKDGGVAEVEMIDSRLHVFTRLDGRATVTPQDKATQSRVFSEMMQRLRNRPNLP